MKNWSRAYALQALSDLRARDVIANSTADRCHRLHFLQMAAEKTCKAYLSAANDNQDVRRTHAYVKQVLPVLARHIYVDMKKNQIPAWQMMRIRQLAAEVEVLAPACDAGDVRRDNCEYPWLDGQGVVQIPCEYKFPNIDDEDKSLTLIIKLLRAAATSLAV